MFTPKDETVGAAVAAVCLSAAEDFFGSDPLGAKSGATPDNIHDARIALRRVRSCLRNFGELFPGDWARELRRDLGWYANELSTLRDLDVFAARIASLDQKAAPDSERAAALELVTARRTAEVQRLALLRDDPRHRLAVVRLEALTAGVPLARRAKDDAATALPKLLRRPYRSFRASGARVKAKPSIARLHELRIRAKELRYTAELSAPVLGDRATRLAKAAQRVQDDIGNQRDALLAAEFLDLALVGRHAPGLRSGRLAAALRRESRVDVSRLRKELRLLRKAWKDLQQHASR